MILTIAIITRRHPENLYNCLKSLMNQTYPDFRVLIIDNDRKKSAYPVYSEFYSMNSRVITYINEPVPGYSHARNCALKNCSTRYIGFIDDDCAVCDTWIETGLEVIRNKKAAFISGKSINMVSNKLFTAVEEFVTKSWHTDFYDKNTFQINHDKIDTKNLIIDADILKRYHILFDNRFNRFGGEDTDLGFQLKQYQLIGLYDEKMQLIHSEKKTFKKFLRKAFSYGYNCYNLYHKWNQKGECRGWLNEAPFLFKNNWNIFSVAPQKNYLTMGYFFFLLKVFNYFYLKGLYQCRKQLKNCKTDG